MMKVYTVSELTMAIKDLIEGSFPPIWVEGEVTNYRPSASGHLYFDLKDEVALIQCVMWRENRMLTTIEISNGKKLRVYGELQVYAKGGRYNLNISRIYPVGIGELQIKFEELKRKLQALGLFDISHKKPIPEFAERIGIVTALDGAAIKDVINIAKRRYNGIEIVVRQSRVQGDGAAYEIAQGINEFNEYGDVDLIIVGRGGGSIEDLWAFNEEIVAYAIYNSKIPVISAVGHEVDFTIADFVADYRAPTPSAAAEIAVKDASELLENISIMDKRIKHGLTKRVNQLNEKLISIKRSYGIKRLKNLIYQKWQTIDEFHHRLSPAFVQPLVQRKTELKFLIQELEREAIQFINNRKNDVVRIEGELSGINPKATLKRGYSICYKLPQRKVVTSSKLLSKEDEVEIEFHKGKAKCEVLQIEN
ncbi:MAG: exodeoxyribonuclease VII large subunit [bacterium]|nr:exodeoxyribonuclease VII large subunit [bacterium]